MKSNFIIIFFLTLTFSQKINLNLATIEDLKTLNININKAYDIINYRETVGNIENLYQL